MASDVPNLDPGVRGVELMMVMREGRRLENGNGGLPEGGECGVVERVKRLSLQS